MMKFRHWEEKRDKTETEKEKELKQLRLLCLVGASCAPLITLFWYQTGSGPVNSILNSLVATVLFVFLYTISHINRLVRNHPYPVLSLTVIIGNIAGAYTCYANHFSKESILTQIMISFSLIWVFRAASHLIHYLVLLSLIILAALYLTDSPEIDRAFFTFFILAFCIFSYINAKPRFNLLNDLRQQEENYRSLVESSPQAIIVYQDGRVVYGNPAALQLFGAIDRKRLEGRTLQDFFRLDGTEDMEALIEQSLGPGMPEPLERRLYHADGRIIDVDIGVSRTLHGKKPACKIVFQDRTNLKQAQEQIRYMAYYDALTGMPNRYLLNRNLEEALSDRKGDSGFVAVMFLDLDRFKLVNDTLGHNIGDRILQQTSERITGCVRSGDAVARYGGDEFVLILRETEEKECSDIAGNILDQFRNPFLVDDHEIFISPSIGISLYPRDADDVVSLLKNADTAMYTAKERGKNNYQFFSRDMNTRISRRMELEIALRKAVANKELELFYQPQVDVANGRIVGMESLVRWRHPVFGVVSPSEFIPLAEETGIINSIGEWVLETACLQNTLWQRSGFPAVPVSVNVSGRQFMDSDFPASVKRILEKTGLENRYLDVEITESILKEIGTVTQIVKDLRAMSVKVSIDDFGTGYSSLNLLKNLSVDNIKIDPSFLWDMNTNPKTVILTKYVIDMGHQLNSIITAEGIEKEEQRNLLAKNGCDRYQGYYFSRPLPARDFEALWRANLETVSE